MCVCGDGSGENKRAFYLKHVHQEHLKQWYACSNVMDNDIYDDDDRGHRKIRYA